MDSLPLSNYLNLLYDSLSTLNLIVTIIVFYIVQLVQNYIAKENRAPIAVKQQNLYFRNLDKKQLKMEEEELQQELEQVKSLTNTKNENEQLRDQLDEEFENEDEDDQESNWSGSIDDKISEEKKELEELEEKAEELKSVEEEICNSLKNLKKEDVLSEPIMDPPPLPKHIDNEDSEDEDLSGKHLSALQELTDRIKQIEAENEELKAQVKSYSSLALAKQQSKIDPDLQQYLEDHSDVLTLSFLEKAHETLLEIKAMNPDKNFDEYIKELQCAQANFDSELERLRVNKKEAEIKLRLMKEEYEKELVNFNEIRIEHIFKNSGAKEYLERLKEKNKLKDETIENLKYELETLKAALADCEMRYHKAEIEYNKMFQGYQQIKVEKEQIEAERRAKERRMLNQTMNLSSASSLVESSVPPMPPLNNIPSIDELLGGSMQP